MERYIIDANVLIRFLVKDHASQAEAARRLFRKAEAGECELVVMPWVAAEVVYTLSSVYRFDRAKIAAVLEEMLSAVGIILMDRSVVLGAISRFAAKNVDFADALLAAEAFIHKLPVASFDRDFDEFADIARYQP